MSVRIYCQKNQVPGFHKNGFLGKFHCRTGIRHKGDYKINLYAVTNLAECTHTWQLIALLKPQAFIRQPANTFAQQRHKQVASHFFLHISPLGGQFHTFLVSAQRYIPFIISGTCKLFH